MDKARREETEIVEKSFESKYIDKISIIQTRIRFYMYKCAENYFKDMSEVEMNYFINLVTTFVLYKWLANDENSKQTCYSFANKKYIEKDRQIRESSYKVKKTGWEGLYDGPNGPDSCCNHLRTAAKELRKNMALQNEQAKEEGQSYKRAPYNKNHSIEYGFLELRFLEAYIYDYLELYKILFNKRDYFVEAPNKKDDERLRYGYDRLNALMENIATNKSDKEFVIGSFQWINFESSYRFGFIAQLAKYMKENNIDPRMQLPENMEILLGRIPITCNDGNCVKHASFPFLLPEICIERIYNNQLLSLNDRVKICGIKFFSETFGNAISTKELGFWSDEDYKDVARFLKDEYKILDYLKPLNLNEVCEGQKSYFDYIRAIVRNNGFFDQRLRKKAMNYSKKKKRSRKKK